MPNASKSGRRAIIGSHDSGIAELLTDILQGAGYEVTEAHTPEELYSCLGTEDYTACIMDVNFGCDMSLDANANMQNAHPIGKAKRVIERRDCKTVLIGITGDMALRQRAEEQGFYALAKPFRDMDRTILEYIEQNSH